MAVLIEALNVVVKESALLTLPDLEITFGNNIPSNAYCGDGLIHRVGFMDSNSVETYLCFLQQLGLSFLNEHGEAQDIVVIDMLDGPTTPCEWIEFRRGKLFSHRTEFMKSTEDFSIAWVKNKFPGILGEYTAFKSERAKVHDFFEAGIAFPFGWNPDKAIYTPDLTLKQEDELEEIERTDRLITYRHKVTGELKYVGIPKLPILPISKTNVDAEPKEADDKDVLLPQKPRNWLQKLLKL